MHNIRKAIANNKNNSKNYITFAPLIADNSAEKSGETSG